jgi:hypothetical protein
MSEPEAGDDAQEPTTQPTFDGPAWQEFSTRLDELAVAHSYAVRGLLPQASDMEEFLAPVEGAADMSIKITPAPPWEWDKGVPSFGEIRAGDIRSFLGPGGTVEALVGHMWVVTVYTEWEVRYRERVAADLGMSKAKDLKVPVLGDLRLIRHDIVHSSGIARADNSGRVEVFTDWITVGKLIVIRERQIVAFMDKLGLAKWEGQAAADEMLTAMKMADSERRRLGVEKITLRRGESDAAAALPDVVQCAVCRQRSRTGPADCPVCGAELRPV